jgi:hypothetical protein
MRQQCMCGGVGVLRQVPHNIEPFRCLQQQHLLAVSPLKQSLPRSASNVNPSSRLFVHLPT